VTLVLLACTLFGMFWCWGAKMAPHQASGMNDAGGRKLRRELQEIMDGPDARDVFDRIFDTTRLRDADEKHAVRTACKAIMVNLLRDNSPHMDGLQQRLAYFCAYHARGEGCWQHHQQWNSVFNSELRGVPIHHRPLKWWPELEQAIFAFESALPAITAEFEAQWNQAKGAQGKTNEKHLILKGTWKGVQLLKPGPELVCNPRFPATCQALRAFQDAVPRCQGGCLNLPAPYYEAYSLQQAAFNTILPGSSVVTHTSSCNQRLKVHCGIYNPSNVSMHIGNETLTWQPGSCTLIDDSFEHSVVSPQGKQARVIIELKMTHPDLLTSSQLLDFGAYQASSGRHPPTVVPINRKTNSTNILVEL